MLRRADQTRDVAAGQRARARLQVVEQDIERLRVELDDVELRDEETVMLKIERFCENLLEGSRVSVGHLLVELCKRLGSLFIAIYFCYFPKHFPNLLGTRSIMEIRES